MKFLFSLSSRSRRSILKVYEKKHLIQSLFITLYLIFFIIVRGLHADTLTDEKLLLRSMKKQKKNFQFQF